MPISGWVNTEFARIQHLCLRTRRLVEGNAVVEHASHHLKVEGSSQATNADTGGVIGKKMSVRSKTIGTEKRKK